MYQAVCILKHTHTLFSSLSPNKFKNVLNKSSIIEQSYILILSKCEKYLNDF